MGLELTGETHKDPASVTQPSIQTEHRFDHRVRPPTNRLGLCSRQTQHQPSLPTPTSLNLFTPDSPRPPDNYYKYRYPVPIYLRLPASGLPHTGPAQHSTDSVVTRG
jgi:hypothetical protein